MERKSLLDPRGWKSVPLFSVEPGLFIFMIATTMSGTIMDNFLLYKTCEKPNYIDSTCDTELDSEMAVSKLNTFVSSGTILISSITTYWAGFLVDHNLKLLQWFLILPAAFGMLTDTLSFVNSAYLDCTLIVLAIYTTLLHGIGGAAITAQLISFMYASHESTEENRSVKLGRVIFTSKLGQAVGVITSGYVVELLGFSCGFLICVVMQCFSILSMLIFTEDLSKRGTLRKAGTSTNSGFGSAIGSFKILLRKRKHHKRTVLILLQIVNIFNKCIQMGLSSIAYLFLRNRFGWKAAQNGVYRFFMLCVEGLGTLISAEIFKRRFQFADTTMGTIASSSMFLYCVWWLALFESWQVYLAPFFGMFRDVIELISMSMAYKCVEPEEYGRVSSLCALTLLFSPISLFVINSVYQNTLRVFPAAVFLYFIPLSLGILIIFRANRRWTWFNRMSVFK